MSFWSAVVAITAIIAFASMRIARYNSRAAGYRDDLGSRRQAPDLPSPREQELTREIEDLQGRLAVLERIATEDRHSRAVAAEIESLRDK